MACGSGTGVSDARRGDRLTASKPSVISTPQARIAAPATAWEYRSSPRAGTSAAPPRSTTTATAIVAVVAVANARATAATAHQFILAAGYMSSGISGSQGPKANTRNSSHGDQTGEDVAAEPAAFASCT